MLCMTDKSYYEWAVKQRDFNFRKNDTDTVNYNFYTMMYLSNVRREHVEFFVKLEDKDKSNLN